MAAALWTYSFGDPPDFTSWYFRRRAGDVMAVLDDGDLVAQIVCAPMTIDVRGKTQRAEMLAGISTAPSYRRQGHMNTLTQALFAHLRDKGVSALALYPFDYGYYRHYGFAGCGEIARVGVALTTLPDGKPSGRVVVAPCGLGDLPNLVRAYEACYARYGGHTIRDEEAFALLLEEIALDGDSYAAVYHRDGRPEGYLLYGMRGKTLCVSEVGAASRQAREDLLGFLKGHASSMDRVEFFCPLDDPLWRLLPEPRGNVSAEPHDMLRILDVARALQGLPAGEGGLWLRIDDAFAPWNEGLWRFESRGGVLWAEKAGEAAAPDADESAGQASDPTSGIAASDRAAITAADTAAATDMATTDAPNLATTDRSVPAAIPTLSIGALTQWVFGHADGSALRRAGEELTETDALAMDRLLPARPVFLYEMY